jgi:hypothetical protein
LIGIKSSNTPPRPTAPRFSFEPRADQQPPFDQWLSPEQREQLSAAELVTGRRRDENEVDLRNGIGDIGRGDQQAGRLQQLDDRPKLVAVRLAD